MSWDCRGTQCTYRVWPTQFSRNTPTPAMHGSPPCLTWTHCWIYGRLLMCLARVSSRTETCCTLVRESSAHEKQTWYSFEHEGCFCWFYREVTNELVCRVQVWARQERDPGHADGRYLLTLTPKFDRNDRHCSTAYHFVVEILAKSIEFRSSDAHDTEDVDVLLPRFSM
jgi:hypothetical protein